MAALRAANFELTPGAVQLEDRAPLSRSWRGSQLWGSVGFALVSANSPFVPPPCDFPFVSVGPTPQAFSEGEHLSLQSHSSPAMPMLAADV